MSAFSHFFRALVSLGPIDARSVLRDGLFLLLVFVPIAAALVVRFGIPPLAEFLAQSLGFDLVPYYPLIMSTLILTAPSIVGVVIGFLLLDERDDGTLAALQVTPLSPLGYLGYRIFLPLIFGFAMTLIAYPLGGLAPLAWSDLVPIALVGMLTAPITAFVLAAFAENKVTGLAVQKALNGIQMLPALAFFLPMPWQVAAGILPTYWPVKMTWAAAAGEPYALYGLAGLAVNLAFLIWLARRFLWRVRS